MHIVPKLRIQIASDLQYEQLIAEIYADEKYVGHISQDKGKESLEFVYAVHGGTFDPPQICVPLSWFLEAIGAAKSHLLGEE